MGSGTAARGPPGIGQHGIAGNASGTQAGGDGGKAASGSQAPCSVVQFIHLPYVSLLGYMAESHGMMVHTHALACICGETAVVFQVGWWWWCILTLVALPEHITVCDRLVQRSCYYVTSF